MKHRPESVRKAGLLTAVLKPSFLARLFQVYKKCTGGKKKLVSGVHMPLRASNNPTKLIQ